MVELERMQKKNFPVWTGVGEERLYIDWSWSEERPELTISGE
jgi:hypothetical protein